MFAEVSFCVVAFSVLGLGDECLQNLENIAAYEGQENIVMSLYADPPNVSWTVISTTDGSNNRTIVNYDGTRDPELVGLYDVNQTGLIIKNATTTGTPISTAGLYIGQCANNTNRTGAMLIVVRDGPQCLIVPTNSSDPSVLCNFTYADSSPQRLSPNVTWRQNGGFIASYKNLVPKKMVAQNVFYAESTVTGNSPGKYECQLSFFIDSPDDQFAYVATNEAEFITKCTVEITPESTLSIQTGPPLTTGTQSMPAETTARSTQTDPPVPTATHLTTAKATTRPPLSTQAGPPVTTTTNSMTAKATTRPPLSPQAGPAARTGTQSMPGQHSSGSLTRKPTNTAAVNGSINIALECSSSYGTNATHWSFTPLGSFNNESIEISNSVSLGSFSNETILISNGNKLLTTNDYYELHATANSSQLIVRLLTNLTEGTYRCNDSVESASALLLTTPFPISMDPLFGPIAGGTNITIIGSLTIIDYISRYVGSYKPNITGVRNVYIGNDLTATNMTFMRNISSPFDFVAVTPATSEASIGKHLPIIIEFSPTPFNITFNEAFIYRPNPNITALNPTSFIVNGGTLLDVTGHNLSSAAKPIIRVTVVITRATVNGSTINTTTTTSRICTFPTGSDDFMQCPMPPVNISVDFQMIIDSLYNSTTSRRRRRDSDLNYLFTYNSHRPHSRVKRAANVALTVNGSNGIDRVDVNLGIKFDGYMRYENINDAFPETRFLLLSPPEIDFTNQVIEFDPSSEELIYIKGKHMQRGCRLIDYVVHVGNQICNNSNLTDNQLSCKPPKEKPSSTENDTKHCDQYLSISITLGYRYIEYRYACLTYKTRSSTFALIVGLTVGFSGLALFLTILIVCIRICRRRKGRKGRQERADGRQIPGDREFINRCYRPDERNNERNEQDSEYDHTIIRRSEKCHSLYADNMHT